MFSLHINKKGIIIKFIFWNCHGDYKKGWLLKNWCFQIMVLEKTAESPLGSKKIKPVNPKGNQPWRVIGKTDAEAVWSPDVNNWLIGKDPDPGKDWRQEVKERTEDEKTERHHQFNGDEFEQALRDSEGQGSLACCSPWGRKESDTA